MNRIYVTTPIYYVNARPHLGHAYTTIVADTVSRFYRHLGYEVFFLTGTDEHGDKIVQAAQKNGQTPQEYVDEISGEFQKTWERLGISYDKFIRTTYDYHKKVVQFVLQRLYEKGEIYLSEYEGKYCFGCERFITEKELVDGKCPDHNTEPVLLKEENYFFRMSQYQDWLIDYIKSHPDFIQPEQYRNEVLGFLREPLEDLCISRPKKRLKWGIPLPFDDNFVTYVWFDALINYLSALGYPNGELFRKFWPVANHIIAKDILKPHGIYWPIMLHAAGIEPYQHLHVHGYWNVKKQKMSKSLGNVVSPLDMAAKYGNDAFRYFLLREMPFGLDANFSEEALVERYNADLANDLGNLVSRSLTMVLKFNQGIVPEPKEETKAEKKLQAISAKVTTDYVSYMKGFAFHKALASVWEFINAINKYIDSMAPWELAKEKKLNRLHTVLYSIAEGLRLVAFLLTPVMPETAKKINDFLGVEAVSNWEEGIKWGRLRPGIKVKRPKALFPRKERIMVSLVVSSQPIDKTPSKPTELISIDDFSKVDIRVAQIIAAEWIKGADKLLKVVVDLGEEQRTLVAGIAKFYKPEDIIGKKVLVVANLKPAKIRGVVSNGMILAASKDGKMVLTTIDGDIELGAKVK